MPQLELHDFVPQLTWLVVCFIALYFIMARVALGSWPSFKKPPI